MGSYSIKELETLSGIKAHTIRIWEKRHNIIAPKRTTTNIRYYSDDDLKKIINVSLLNNSGLKISKIARMTDPELNSEIVQLAESKSEASIFIDQLVVCMIDMEEEQFEKLLSHLIMKFGFERTITEIVYPFLEKIGILWQTGNITPAQEHFISNLVRQKIIVAIDSLPFPKPNAIKVVLFLPENELHEIGLLFYHYLVRACGYKTFYLGQHLPYDDLKQVCAKHEPAIIITSIIASQRPQKIKIFQHPSYSLEATPIRRTFRSAPILR
ncbi:MAG: MerR family transcriptional regulator [Cyclobacteriaceae bacterium]|nr:MerR family transcriptional regulator [Cyclobacteriaceae bacterium]